MQTQQLMIKKVMPKTEYEVHKKLCEIKHKNIIEIFDVVIDGETCIVLEQFIMGKTIEQMCAEKTLSEKDTKAIISQICDGLNTLHKNNIVHRDINPSNVMISDEGIVKIIDFDISRLKNKNANKDTIILGTQGYAAPEQFGFAQSAEQTDIYSLGVMMNYMLTGEFPVDKMYEGRLSETITKCIQLDPEKRYRSANHLKKSIFKNCKPESFIEYLPGCNTDSGLKKFALLIFYALVVLYSITAYTEYGNVAPPISYISVTIHLVFFLYIPIILMSNFMGFQNRLPGLRKLNPIFLRILFDVIGLASICVGMEALSFFVKK